MSCIILWPYVGKLVLYLKSGYSNKFIFWPGTIEQPPVNLHSLIQRPILINKSSPLYLNLTHNQTQCWLMRASRLSTSALARSSLSSWSVVAALLFGVGDLQRHDSSPPAFVLDIALCPSAFLLILPCTCAQTNVTQRNTTIHTSNQNPSQPCCSRKSSRAWSAQVWARWLRFANCWVAVRMAAVTWNQPFYCRQCSAA